MTAAQHPATRHVIRPEARLAWRKLQAALAVVDPPCREPYVRHLWLSDDPREVADARDGCRRCPVAELCREYATTAGEPAGVWGGTTPAERGASDPDDQHADPSEVCIGCGATEGSCACRRWLSGRRCCERCTPTQPRGRHHDHAT